MYRFNIPVCFIHKDMHVAKTKLVWVINLTAQGTNRVASLTLSLAYALTGKLWVNFPYLLQSLEEGFTVEFLKNKTLQTSVC